MISWSEQQRLASFKKTMAAKKRRKEYEKSPEGQEEERQRIEKLNKRHRELALEREKNKIKIPETTISLDEAVAVGQELLKKENQ